MFSHSGLTSQTTMEVPNPQPRPWGTQAVPKSSLRPSDLQTVWAAVPTGQCTTQERNVYAPHQGPHCSWGHREPTALGLWWHRWMAASPTISVWEALFSALTVGVGMVKGGLGVPWLLWAVLTDHPIAPGSSQNWGKIKSDKMARLVTKEAATPCFPSWDA